MVITFPVALSKPGLRATPSNFTVPFSFENSGSSAQRLINDPDFETEVTLRASFGKETSAETALMAPILLLTTRSTEKVFPTFVVTDDGESVRLAAYALMVVLMTKITPSDKRKSDLLFFLKKSDKIFTIYVH